jgi:hypothetical protein
VPELVTFLHEHTVHVDGLGDVCSLAQMDITRDGDIRLASLNQSVIVQQQSDKEPASKAVGRRNTVYGKVELSLLNFATQNPDWSPPKMSAEFIQNVKELVRVSYQKTSVHTSTTKLYKISKDYATTCLSLKAILMKLNFSNI